MADLEHFSWIATQREKYRSRITFLPERSKRILPIAIRTKLMRCRKYKLKIPGKNDLIFCWRNWSRILLPKLVRRVWLVTNPYHDNDEIFCSRRMAVRRAKLYEQDSLMVPIDMDRFYDWCKEKDDGKGLLKKESLEK